MQQPAEPVASVEAIELQQLIPTRRFVYRRRLRERRPLGERAVRPVFVVVLGIDADDALEVAAAEDQQPVEALAAQAFDPALGVRTRSRRPYRLWVPETRISGVSRGGRLMARVSGGGGSFSGGGAVVCVLVAAASA
jgi:uncharacterized membrane protein YgcG